MRTIRQIVIMGIELDGTECSGGANPSDKQTRSMVEVPPRLGSFTLVFRIQATVTPPNENQGPVNPQADNCYQ